jgi:hypothetical protein
MNSQYSRAPGRAQRNLWRDLGVGVWVQGCAFDCLSVCVSVCVGSGVYVCDCLRECVCLSVYRCVSACVCLYGWVCACACVCVRLCVRARVCVCVKREGELHVHGQGGSILSLWSKPPATGQVPVKECNAAVDTTTRPRPVRTARLARPSSGAALQPRRTTRHGTGSPRLRRSAVPPPRTRHAPPRRVPPPPAVARPTSARMRTRAGGGTC